MSKATFRRYRRPVRPARPIRARLQVERLEDRAVPANFTAAHVSELMADITAANLTPEADTITLAAGKTFTLTQVNNYDHGPTGLPVIAAGSGKLTVIGSGAVIERSTATGTPSFRLFDVAAGASLTLENMTLQGGRAFGAGVWAQGGAIFNLGALTLTSVTVQSNTAKGGDGIPYYLTPANDAAAGGLYSNGTLTLAGCTIKNNAAVGGRGYDGTSYNQAGKGGSAFGGGLYSAGGTLIVSNTTFTGNTAQGGDGGNNPYATVFSGGVFSDGVGSTGGDGFGGGFYAAGSAVTLHNSSLTKNVAQGGLGGRGAKGNLNGAAGQGVGGGIYIGPTAAVGLDAFTVGHVKTNKASTSNSDIFGQYVGL